MRAELRSLKRLQVWLALLIGTVGFGGMFATYSYIAPTMTELTGYARAAVPLILAIYGIGMTTGAFLSGRVAAYGLMRGIFFCLAAIAVILAMFGHAAHNKVTAVLAVFLLGLVPTILVPMLQTRLMDVAHEGSRWRQRSTTPRSTWRTPWARGWEASSWRRATGMSGPVGLGSCWHWQVWASPRSRCGGRVVALFGRTNVVRFGGLVAVAGYLVALLGQPPSAAGRTCPSGHSAWSWEDGGRPASVADPRSRAENPVVPRILR
jgi:MFS family permease